MPGLTLPLRSRHRRHLHLHSCQHPRQIAQRSSERQIQPKVVVSAYRVMPDEIQGALEDLGDIWSDL